ncbi:MAG: group III truncated hemoglobin [Chitinophagaceae bacterium]
MNDIQTTEDIAQLVNRFYSKVVEDPLIKHFFTTVAHFSWEVHIPIMVTFWDSVLLGAATYKGQPMDKHFALHKLSAMEHTHFERWLQLWEQTVNENFSGPIAADAVARAKSIARIMELKLQ